MVAYADTTDVAAELGRPASSTSESTQWEAWIDRVERTIERRFSRLGLVLAEQVGIGDLTADDVMYVEVAAIIRKIDNPSGLTSITRSVDDSSVTTRREGVDSGDPLELTEADWESLLPAHESEAFTIRPFGQPGFADEAI